MTIPEQIILTRSQLERAKPRSRRRIELEIKLRALVLRQMRREIREAKNES